MRLTGIAALERVLLAEHDTPFMVFTPGGLKEKAYNLKGLRGGVAHQILPHPSGRKVLVLGGSTLL